MRNVHRLLVVIGVVIILVLSWDIMMPQKSQAIPDSAIHLKVDSQVKDCGHTIFLSGQ